MSTMRAACLLIAAVFLGSVPLRAQCAQNDSSPQARLEEAARACSPALLHQVAAVWEDRTVPGLRAFYGGQLQVCAQIRRAARAALAKLGDAAAFGEIVSELRTEQLNTNAIKDLGLIGDDRAIAALMTYVVERESDRSRVVDFGDYNYDPMYEIAAVMHEVAGRRLLRGVSAEATQIDWKDWWQKNRGSSPLSVAVYQEVSDSYLHCLARKVEWGFPNAILEMANQRGKAAEETLRRFPRRSSRQPLGTIGGNLEAALAKLGEQAAFSGIVAELKEVRSSFGGAVPKLEYIGDKAAVSALLSVLGAPTPGLVKAKAALSRPTDDENEKFLLQDRYRVELQIDREYQISILQALAHMVKKPPLPADAPPSPDSFRKWQDWWARNRDKVELVRAPPGKYE